MIRRPPRSTQSRSSAASDVYKRQVQTQFTSESGVVATALCLHQFHHLFLVQSHFHATSSLFCYEVLYEVDSCRELSFVLIYFLTTKKATIYIMAAEPS